MGAQLPKTQAACLESYLVVGHPVDLFCYEKPDGTPDGVNIRDAQELMPRDQVFAYGPSAGVGEGSLAACSNIFRYTLLNHIGGYWIDADVFCLRPLPFQDVVIPQEITPDGIPTAASCILRSPPRHAFSAFCLNASVARKRDSLIFGEIGPLLVQRAVEVLDLADNVFPPRAFCPINYTDSTRLLNAEEVPSDAYTLHLWNETWRRRGQQIPWPGPAGSLLEKLSHRLKSRVQPEGSKYA